MGKLVMVIAFFIFCLALVLSQFLEEENAYQRGSWSFHPHGQENRWLLLTEECDNHA